MTSLSDNDIRHIANLARLTISDDEVAQYSKELTSILAFIDQLQEVDTSSVEATAQVTGLRYVTRDDEVYENPIDPDDILSCSPLPITEHQIQTPSAHES